MELTSTQPQPVTKVSILRDHIANGDKKAAKHQGGFFNWLIQHLNSQLGDLINYYPLITH